MKKCVWLLCLFLTAFSLISCGKLFEPAEDPEKKYLSVTTMTSNDALAYIGDITNSFPSPNDHYVVRNCFGYSELYVKSVVMEYHGLSQAYSTYFANLETNTRMQFDYVNPVYTSSREYVEFIIYFEPEMLTDGYPASAVAYELRYLCGDFTNPPATGNYAKQLILSPDMQIDILAEKLIVTGEKIHYWGSPSAGQLKVQSAPVLTNAIGIPSSNNGNNGNNGGDGYGAVQDYPSFIADFGDLLAVYSYRSDGNTSPVVDADGSKMYSYYAEYSSLKSEVTLYFNSQPGYAYFQRGSGITENAAHSYIEFSVFSDADDSLRYYDIRYLADLNRKISGEACTKTLNVDPDDLNGFNSIFEYLCSILPCTHPIDPSAYPDVWSQMEVLGDIKAIYANFDDDGNIMPTSYYGSNPAESFLVEYTSLDDAVLAYKDKYRPVNTAYTPYEYLFDSDCYYVEYSKLTDFDYLSVYLLDTQKLQSDNYSAVSVGPAGLGLIDKSDSIIDYIRYGGMKQIDSSTAPDVWNRMNEIGSGLTLYAEFDSFGQLMADEGQTTYYGAYSAFNDTASEYCDNTAHYSGFPIAIEATFIQDHSFYLEYNIYDDDSSSPDKWEATLYSADEFLNGNHDCGVGVHGYKSKSIQYTIQSESKGFSERSSYPLMLDNFGCIYSEGGDPQVYTLNSGNTIRDDFGWEGIEGKYYFVEYESLSDDLISFFSTSSLTYDSMYAELDYPVDISHYYVEYLQGNDNAGGLLLFDTQAFKDGNALYAKGIKMTSSDLDDGDWDDLWEYIQNPTSGGGSAGGGGGSGGGSGQLKTRSVWDGDYPNSAPWLFDTDEMATDRADDIWAMFDEFDNQINSYKWPGTTTEGYCWLAEYSSLKTEVINFFAALSIDCSGISISDYDVGDDYDSTKYYIEFWLEKENPKIGMLFYDTTAFLNGEEQYAKKLLIDLTDIEGTDLWNYINSNQP